MTNHSVLNYRAELIKEVTELDDIEKAVKERRAEIMDILYKMEFDFGLKNPFKNRRIT